MKLRLILGAAVVLASAVFYNATALGKSPRTAQIGRPIRDHTFTFDVFRLQCGSGRAGDEDSMFRPDQLLCAVAIGVVNEGDRRPLDPYSHYLEIGQKQYGTSRRAMLELTLDERNSLFSRAIPTGGGGLASLFFEIPRGTRPTRIELHEAADSRGARGVIMRCSWSHNGGSCRIHQDRGAPGNAYPRTARIGVRYPHAMMLDQPTCFDGIEWTAVLRQEPNDFWGQGMISRDQLRSIAYFFDNSGSRITLVPTQQNERDPRVCG